MFKNASFPSTTETAWSGLFVKGRALSPASPQGRDRLRSRSTVGWRS